MDPTQQDRGRGETSRMSSGVRESWILVNEALELSHAMGELKIYSDKEFESAKERFKDVCKRATNAFCNAALNINDKIFAANLRVVSEILECLDSLQTAITGCLSFLQDLHIAYQLSVGCSPFISMAVSSRCWVKQNEQRT
ncbi:Hypothetical predicted protein [Paramuricea clavata]|uniref:Uncharacterized protein n=1 Tax=Paramuricea clavata TaxID=317549 RepID=A0A7D9HDV2_PARCT|nr:Hypothetical predicted protein [Paramuricea clavata]